MTFARISTRVPVSRALIRPLPFLESSKPFATQFRLLQPSCYISARGYADDRSQTISAYQLGVGSNDYIPPTGQNLPKATEHTRLYFKALGRYQLHFFKQTLTRILLRLKYRTKLDYKDLETRSEDIYIELNKFFAARKSSSLSRLSTMFVEENLKDRIKNMNKDWKLSWALEDTIEKTRCVSVSPIALGQDEPLQFVQLIYRFHTLQKLELTYTKNKNIPKQLEEKKVLDYVVYVYDIQEDDLRIMGSVFETPVTEPLPVQMTSEKLVLAAMQTKGDLFRKRPALPKF
ncbi:mitochondrial inner membrane protein Mba1 [Lipomyces tetrasporus]|uniref:Mitochondrial inner membrane protein Mba1 n=1 Tax=Lipomyces tetrasporus TaxID=54092 RepID=A0AAD7QYI0_9ASCO|nr:mitochondrial inner membrane protein Mba1 [Lipomyces tetrasporus]KAJ8102152.1 mitochondrial inner membrane protein Mba1 [Lipomyces tetrasporus]